MAGFLSKAADGTVETRPAVGIDFALKGVGYLMLRFRSEFDGNQVFGTRAQACTDIITGDDEILALIINTTHQQMHVGIVGIPVFDGDPV